MKNVFKKKKKVVVVDGKQTSKDVATNIDGEQHVRVGDYCNTCNCHISECSYFKNINE